MASTDERLALTGSKGIVTMVLTTLLGGGLGAGVVGLTAGSTKPADAQTWLTRAEVQQVATEAEAKAKGHADVVAGQVRDDCRRELAQAQAQLAATLARVEGKVDRLADDVGQLKVDVAELKTRRGK